MLEHVHFTGGVYSPTLAFWAGMRFAKIASFPRIRRTESLVKALLISSSPAACLALAVATSQVGRGT